MTRRRLVAANWKMHGQEAEVAQLLRRLLELDGSPSEVVICPPALFIPQVREALGKTDLQWGAQNAYSQQEGAFTGEISARMLKDFDCSHVIIGHSERRAIFAESDVLVAEKFAAVQSQGLKPILCVGETLAQREAGETDTVIREQLEAVLAACGVGAFTDAVLAYEPVWAIGTGRSASPEQAQEVHAMIRARLAAEDAEVAAGLQMLYGGSVKAANAAALFAQPDIDGALVGGASLKAEEFIAICSLPA